MERRKFLKGAFFSSLVVLSGVGVEADAREDENGIVNAKHRSADPCEKWRVWSGGQYPLVTPEFRKGSASHKMAPAKIIKKAGDENGVNPVLLLALMEWQEDLISIPARGNKRFEERLFYALRYAIDKKGGMRCGGFFAQLVGASFQLSLSPGRGETIEDVCLLYFRNKDVEELRKIYEFYAREFSHYTDVDHSVSMDSPEVFTDFRDVKTVHIQKFLEERQSTLAVKDLFRRPPVDDSIDYRHPPCDLDS